ncbi:MAG: putative virion DNA-directed RNA polymerase [Prokaryotic dsDNA virus sp.]|mgnify:CR=1 FL=1|nr:MAG: putative virion DNA-directed RNA polymerase [Prokaryotic dsDNA virus sp.]
MASNFDRVFGNYGNSSMFDQMVEPYLKDTLLRGAPREDVRIPTKLDNVAIASERKKQEVQKLSNPYRIGAVRNTGTGLSTIENPVQRDMAVLNAWDMIGKYGPDAASLISQAAAGQNMFEFDRRSSGPEAPLKTIGDAALGVGQGFANAFLGIGSLALGGVDALTGTEMGTWSARKLGDMNEFIDEQKSDANEIAKRTYATMNELDQADNQELFEEDRIRDGEFVASLRRFGRDTVDTLGNIWENPEITSDIVSQGAGSLLAGGPLSKGLKSIGRKALETAVRIRPATLASTTAARVADIGGRSAMPLAIGAMEAGGAYQQTVNEALNLLNDRDDLTDAEKADLANKAGLQAASIQAPVGTLTGALVSKFEASPLAARGVVSATKNIGKEGVEETAQSASGQLAQNLAIRNNVDPSRDLSEGVGEQAASGLVGGVGAAGVVQVPGTALRTTVQAAKLTGRTAARVAGATASAVMRGIEDRNKRVLEKIEEESPVAAPKMDAAIDAAREAAPNISTEAQETINSADFTPEERQSVVDHFDRVLSFDPETEAAQAPDAIKTEVAEATDRFDAVRRVASIAKDESQTPEKRLSAGLYLMETLRNNEAMLETVPEEALSKLPQDDPAVTQIEDYQSVLGSLSRHPLVRDAINEAVKLSENLSEDQVSDERISTPEGQETAKNAVRLASLAPEKTKPEVNKKILLHSVQGKVTLTANERGHLNTANAVHEASARHNQRSEELDLTPSEIVSQEIQTDKSNPSTLHKSAIAHMEGVQAAIEADNAPLAQRRMRHFMAFAQSMQNKVRALNESLIAGDASDKKRTKYQAYNPRIGEFFDSPGAYLIGSSPGSIAQAQQTAVDAEAVAYIANEMVKSFTQLGVDPVEVVELHPSMTQTSAREAARDYRVAKKEDTLSEFLSLSEATNPNKPVSEALSKSRAEQVEPEVTEDRPSQDPQSKLAPERKNSQAKDAENPQQQSDTEAQTDEVTPARDQSAEKPQSGTEQSRPVSEEAPKEVPETPDIQENEDQQDRPDQLQDQQEAEQEDRPTGEKVRGIEAAFPNLLGSGNSGDTAQENLFKSSFDIPAKEPISRLTGTEDTLSLVRGALRSPTAFRKMVGDGRQESVAGRITTAMAKAYDRLLASTSDVVATMDDRLSSIFKERIQKKKKFDLGFEELRAMNIAEQNGELVSYNASLRDSAILAGLQWLLTSDQRRRPMDAEDVAKILAVPVHEVTTEQVERFNQGAYLAASVNELGEVITRFWGVTPNSSAPYGVTRGIPEGVGKEVLAAMNEAGLVKINEIKENGKTYYQVESLAEQKLGSELYSELMAWPSAIEVASIVEPEETTFLGSPPPTVPKTQLRNPLVSLTRQQREMAENEQATPYRLNLPMISLLEDLGEEASVALFGHGNLTEDAMNVNHRRSLESINLTVRSAYKSIMARLSEASSWGQANGVEDAGQVPIHYAYEFTSVNRLQMVGAHNPQANKLTREAILPTWSELDLTNPEQRSSFLLGIAQAWGVKVHKMPRKEAIKEVRKMASESGQMAPALELLSGRNAGQVFSDEDIQVLRDSLGKGGPVPAVALHAAMEFVRYQNGSKEDRSNFRTSLYVEADGITDGPINAMVHAARGTFNDNWLNVVRKGGLFLGSPGMTANASTDKVDLYEHTTGFLRQAMSRMRSEFASNPETGAVARQMDVLLRMMAQLLPDITINDKGELVVERGLVKNPLTVTIYGAGPSGIASKITEALLGAVYERESQKVAFLKDRPKASKQEIAEHLFGQLATTPERALELYDEYNSEMSKLVDQRVEITQEGLRLNEDARPRDNTGKLIENRSMRDGPQGFTLLPGQVSNIQSNVLRLLVRPMREAIEASIGETTQGVDALRRSTQVQSIYLEHAFRRAVQQKLDEKKKADPSFRKSDFLTNKELTEIYDSLNHLAPYIRTGNQNMLVSGSKKAPIGENDSSVSFSRTLDGRLATPASIFGPSNSGVSGIPYVIIGTGDGLMMQIASTMAGAPEGTLKIFDGMNMPLDKIEEQSRSVNEAVYRGWMENPLEAVATSYSDFVKDADVETISSDEQRIALSEALLGPGKTEATNEEIIEMIRSLDTEMSQIARESQARKNALARVQMTVDHMASAEASYDAEGNLLSLEGLTDQEILSVLNELYAEELNKLSKAEDTKKKTEENTQKGRIFGEIEAVPASDLPRFIAQLNVNQDQKKLMLEAARALKDTDWVLTSPGSTETVNGVKAEGYTDFGDRRIVIGNGSAETTLHELIHAATLDKVAAFYSTDPEQRETLSKEELEAIGRIEALMDEWLDNVPSDLPNLNEAGRTAMLAAQSTILGHLGNGQNGAQANRANALNEFMAWVLSNQDLARAAGRRKVKNPIARIVGEALDYLKKLFGLRGPSSDIYSNLRFNTGVLMRSPRSVGASLADTILFQSSDFGSSNRLTELREAFFNKVARHMNGQPNAAARATQQYKAFVAKVQADAVFESFDAHGFPMDAQQASTFQMMVAALATEIELNPNSLQRVQDLFEHVTKNLRPSNFRENPDDPNDNADEYQAQEKYRSITGTYLMEIDEQGRSTLLPAFLALAAVHDGFRKVLAGMPMPKGDRLPNDTLDNRLTNLGSELMDRLAFTVSGEEGSLDTAKHLGKSAAPSIGAAIDALTDRLAEIDDDQKSRIEQFVEPAGTALDKSNAWVISQMKDLSRKSSDKLEELKARTRDDIRAGKSVKALANFGQLVAGIFDEDVAQDQARSIMSLANKSLSSKTAHEFLNELVGRTTENAPVYDMIKAVRSAVHSTRQQFREHLPELLEKRFDRDVTSDEWSTMFRSMGKTDLASLRSGYSVKEITEFLGDFSKISNERSKIEKKISGNTNGSLIIQKAQELADFMRTGKAPLNLLRNANAIERLLNEGVRVSPEVDTGLVRDIDQLVTLMALDGLSDLDKNQMSSLVQEQQKGVEFILSYLEGQRQDEISKVDSSSNASLNHFKGYIPQIQEGKHEGRTLVVADDQEYVEMRRRGMTRVADYVGSRAENSSTSQKKMGYYFSTLSGRSAYNQGVMQTARLTASGVDPVTGYSTSVMTAGRITDPDTVQKIQKRLSRLSGRPGTGSGASQSSQGTGEHLMPVFDASGALVAYERSLDSLQEERLGRSSNLAEMIGAWRGRQVEEVLGQKFNEVLAEKLFDVWDQAETTRRDEFVNLMDPREQKRDPVMADAVNLIPREAKAKIEELFGEKQLWVRRDMINDAIGYRKASIGDNWTGVTRHSEQTQKQVQDLATSVFGADAYKKMVQAETVVQNVVTDARVLIVVKSVIVPFANLMANIYQLTGRGVPLANTIKGMPKKLSETNGYVRDRLRVMEIDAELRAAEGANNTVRVRKLTAEKQSIEDGFRRLSIWPLIEAGELTSVSDVGIGKEEIELSEGRLTNYMENAVSKLPPGIRTAGRYFIVGRDTALFKGLQKSIEYGDFLAKAILYEDLTKRQGLSKEEALSKVTEEYVNYDRLAGRSRDYLENMGLMWFWNFKIRSTKVALSMIRNNPVHAMLSLAAPTPPMVGTVGSPLTDNLVSIGMDGRLDYSVGPGQGLRSHQLLPWVQLVD